MISSSGKSSILSGDQRGQDPSGGDQMRAEPPFADLVRQFSEEQDGENPSFLRGENSSGDPFLYTPVLESGSAIPRTHRVDFPAGFDPFFRRVVVSGDRGAVVVYSQIYDSIHVRERRDLESLEPEHLLQLASGTEGVQPHPNSEETKFFVMQIHPQGAHARIEHAGDIDYVASLEELSRAAIKAEIKAKSRKAKSPRGGRGLPQLARDGS